MNRVIEIRTYNLRPGARAQFHRLMAERALPMLRRWDVDVVYVGPSVEEDNVYVLIRAYLSLKDREQSQDRFYGSEEWKKGPREPLLALIETYLSVVLTVDEATIDGLRKSGQPEP